MTSCCPPPRMRWSGATDAIARCKRSRTLKVRGEIIFQANRYLGGFSSSQRIFSPQTIQVLLILLFRLPPKAGMNPAMIEATFCQDKQALGLVTRRQRRWEAQQMVLLLARLAHHLLLRGKQWLSRMPTTRRRLQGYGLVRLLRDVWAVPGVIRWRRGWMVSVRFSPLHPLATPLQASFSALFRGRVRVGYLR